MATIRKRGGKYQVQVRRQGVGSTSKSFHTLKDAETWARQTEIQADRHDLPSDRKVLTQITLGQLVTRYRDTVSIKKRGYEVERIRLNALLLHPMCRRSLSELTGAHFAAYRDERLREVKPATLKRQLGPIHNLFEIARDEWGIPLRENPLAKLQLNAPDDRRERRLRPGELDRLIAASGCCRNPLTGRIILFALETAMRRGEILNVRTDDIDAERYTLLIPTTKNGQPRIIPLTTKALALLLDVDGDSEIIFPISANAFRLSWERVKRRAKIENLHFHDLRHEAISRFFEKGLSTPEVALISGHRDMRMLFRYAHANRERVLEKLEAQPAAPHI
ncbi:MAG: site-specific integrase [Hyphomicrobiales bacterium]